jgi:hypothetical protein
VGVDFLEQPITQLALLQQVTKVQYGALIRYWLRQLETPKRRTDSASYKRSSIAGSLKL